MINRTEDVPTKGELADRTRNALKLTDRFLRRHAQARDKRPDEPDDSLEARLFSTYDAVEAALGWLTDSGDGLDDLEEEPATESPDPGEGGSEEAMKEDVDELCDTLEELMAAYALADPEGPHGETQPEGEDAKTLRRAHEAAEAAAGRLSDASDLILGRASPKDNPAPYESGAE